MIRTHAQAILDATSFAHDYSESLQAEVARLRDVIGAKDMELDRLRAELRGLKQRMRQSQQTISVPNKRRGVHHESHLLIAV